MQEALEKVGIKTEETKQSEEEKQTANFAYKVIFLADGVGALFEEIHTFGANDIKVGIDEENRMFIALGRNLILITPNIMRALRKHRTFFLYKSPLESYDNDSVPIAFEIEKEAMIKLEELWKRNEKLLEGECGT